MAKAEERVLILRGGHLTPRVLEAPLLSSSGSGWSDLCLERHRLTGPAESKGVIEGFQICCNLSGPVAAEWLIRGTWRGASVSSGDLCIATHGEFRSVAWQNSYDLLLVSISPRMMAEASQAEGPGRAVELIPQIAFRDPNIQGMCRLLLADIAAGTPMGPLYGDHLAWSLAIYLSQHFGQLRPRAKVPASSLPGAVLQRVCDFIEASLDKPIGVRDLAREGNMSRFHFSRMFRNSTGQSPYRYLTQRRIERAKEAISRGFTDEEVAKATGFSSASHLGSLFRKYAGVSTRRFRSSLR